ncbi:MAG: Stp1/IreP family PP2C-type Ser/Thr phosphatase [Solirubrobacteraceae bacterium]|jgi:protein phosphatase
MIRVAEHVARTDTGHQRSTNEDAHLSRAPLFVIADGMGGAQAGEVASQIAIKHFEDTLPGADADSAGERLALAVQAANAEIHALSERDARRAGMGTTLTAAHVGSREVTFAHVGDSRAYLLRDGELERITEDHSLVEELLRQGRLTEEEAEEHPQRSIITRALGPESDVEVDTFTRTAEDGDIYLICSDGLTSMVPETTVAEIMREAPDITAAAERLVAAALDAGGRDNVTVVLFRVEDVAGAEEATGVQEAQATVSAAEDAAEPAAAAGLASAGADLEQPPAAEAVVSATGPARRVAPEPAPFSRIHRRAPRMPRAPARRGRSRLRRRATLGAVVLAVVGVLALAAVLATQAVYFIGTDSYGQVTIYNGVPYTLPGGVRLYTQFFVSGVTAAELSPLERGRLFNNELRSQSSATSLVSQLELDRIAGQ